MRFSDAINGFYLYQIGGNYSPITAEGYRRNLRLIDQFLEYPPLEAITKDDLFLFLAQLKIRGRTESTRRAYWRTIRSFYTWVNIELGLPRVDDLPAPAGGSKEIIPYTHDECEALKKAAGTKRIRAILYIFLDTGVRVSEMARMKVGDLDLNIGTIKINPFFNGRKSKSRTVRIGNRTRRIVWEYMTFRHNPKSEAPLIASRDEKFLNRFGISKILTRIGKNAGVVGVGPHRFRHTFAIEFLRNGGDIFSLQELLGHSTLSMVRRYLAISQADVEDAHRRASPVDNWRL